MNALREFASWCPDVEPLDDESSERIWAEVIGRSSTSLESETSPRAAQPVVDRVIELPRRGHMSRHVVATAAAVLLVLGLGAVAALQLRGDPNTSVVDSPPATNQTDISVADSPSTTSDPVETVPGNAAPDTTPDAGQPVTDDVDGPAVTQWGSSAEPNGPVVVANASDVGGIAGSTMYHLELEGYDVLEAVNAAASVGMLDESIVYARPGHEGLRDELAARLGIGSTADLDAGAPLPIDGTHIDHDQVAVLIMLGRDFNLLPDPDTISHADFGAYVAQAREVFGDIRIGDSCADWPERGPAETAHLVVLPVVNGDGGRCQVRGWTYSSAFSAAARDQALFDDSTGNWLSPIFDDDGDVIDHFDVPTTSTG